MLNTFACALEGTANIFPLKQAIFPLFSGNSILYFNEILYFPNVNDFINFNYALKFFLVKGDSTRGHGAQLPDPHSVPGGGALVHGEPRAVLPGFRCRSDADGAGWGPGAGVGGQATAAEGAAGGCGAREAAGRPGLHETGAVLGEEEAALQEADSGVLRLAEGDPFPREHTVVWLGVQALGFVLVCEAHENLLLAEGTLRSLARHCLEHLRLLGTGSEVLLKADRIEVLLHRLLPHGQLLFLNHRFKHSLDKELGACLAR
ncbi:AP-5 complex subunit sigma-1 isoform X1 [Lepisosteus oculatus]|uniref:AP-5 complex subunit sigma-1 isoform X1 n=1 Tax=Lepisosteus oculatus TaxID=7918 RepID=UPI0035F52614